ncbi:MAG: SPOR domain-containing protein [Paludibacteraceae bacterium]|nr:SPOR domain-containing protein [Candidatus Physcocola equi]MCQ2233303.1 SPOR domain-containing protein [Paludibacteraceae bacterium]
MKKSFSHIIKAIAFFFTLLICGMAQAQTSANIFNDLKAPKDGQGKVSIEQDAKISQLLEKKKAAYANKKEITFSGYRVQVYMGNQQKKSKDDASARESGIKSKFPGVTTYLTFSAPFWRLRVGDFRTHAEAMVLANKLKAAYPSWEGDIYIVRDNEVVNTDAE